MPKKPINNWALVSAAIATTSNEVEHDLFGPQISLVSSGTVSTSTGAATILIEVSSNNGLTWELLATHTLVLGTAITSTAGTANAAWNKIRARVTAISGTNASVDTWIGNSQVY